MHQPRDNKRSLSLIESCERFHFERKARSQGYQIIAGVDEAGRGPIAGPLVVAACILPDNFSLKDVDDSKKLSVEKRDRLYERITTDLGVVFSIVVIEKEIIDLINILQATFRGMQEAVEQLRIRPDYVLVDGNKSPSFSVPSEPVIQGDSLSYSIGAASILAKVKRDAIMMEYDAKWPEYGFAKHKGYPTEAHIEALERFGPCPIHRASYGPVKRVMELGRDTLIR